jgi:glycosyltransferase involved in cell wall biosynthesis
VNLLSDVWVVIPAKNEAASIADVVVRARRYTSHVVVVDDVSEDDTVGLALDAGAVVLPLCTSLDAWGATQTGIRYARRQGARVVVTLDADGQHPPEMIPSLVEPVRLGDFDLLIGSDQSRASQYRHFAWHYLRALTGLTVEDLTSGFRAYSHRAIDVLVQPEATALNYQDIGVLILLRRQGLSMRELPVSMAPRVSGSSRVFRSWMRVVAYMLESSVIGLAGRSRI